MASLFIDTICLIALVIWQTLVAMIRFFIPSAKKDVSKEIVLITGAGSGLGRLMCLRFASLGAVVVCIDINEEANEETAQEIRSKDQRAFAFTCDLSKKEDIYRIAEEVKSQVGDVTILVNNAGIVSGRKFLDTPDSLVEKTFEVNTLAHCWTTKAFLPSMLENDHGHIVSISSAAGLFGTSGLCDYCGSKFGAFGFNESLQMELAVIGKKNVHTTVVCPFYINTGMFDGVQTRYPLFLPIMTPDYAVGKIMDATLTNQRILIMPRILHSFLFLKSILPQESYISLSEFFGVTTALATFKGRNGKKAN